MSETRTCKVCATIFSRPPNESAARFEGRKYCSASCFAAGKAAAALAKLKPKVCEHCKETYHPPEGLRRAAEWSARQYCSEACSRAARIKTAKPKCCPICKTEFTKPLGISVPKWNAQVYCGKACADVGRKKFWANKRSTSEPRKSAPRSRKAARAPLTVARPVRVKLPAGKVETVEEYLARKGQVTICPTAHAGPSDHYRTPSAADLAALARYHAERNAEVTATHVARAKKGHERRAR